MYKLELTHADVEAIAMVGNRYHWSAALEQLTGPGINELAEHEAWQLRDAFEADMEGGHSPFPLLNPDSLLSAKLYRLWDSIV